MFRKLFIRLFMLCVCLSGAVVLALLAAGYAALQEPAFYAELRTQDFSRADEIATEASFKLMERDLAFWTKNSLARQQQNEKMKAPLLVALADQAGDYDPRQDFKSIKITQAQVNTALASSKAARRGDWRNPRIRIAQDQIDLAVEIVASNVRCILSAELKPTLMDDGRLKLELHTARVGKLPLPIQTILQWLPHKGVYADDNMELNLTGSAPHICVSLPTGDSESPTVQSVQCLDGEIAIRLLPPILQAEQTVDAEDPLAVFIVD